MQTQEYLELLPDDLRHAFNELSSRRSGRDFLDVVREVSQEYNVEFDALQKVATAISTIKSKERAEVRRKNKAEASADPFGSYAEVMEEKRRGLTPKTIADIGKEYGLNPRETFVYFQSGGTIVGLKGIKRSLEHGHIKFGTDGPIDWRKVAALLA